MERHIGLQLRFFSGLETQGGVLHPDRGISNSNRITHSGFLFQSILIDGSLPNPLYLLTGDAGLCRFHRGIDALHADLSGIADNLGRVSDENGSGQRGMVPPVTPRDFNIYELIIFVAFFGFPGQMGSSSAVSGGNNGIQREYSPPNAPVPIAWS